MRVLVTGAAGLCGTHLIEALVKEPEVSRIYGLDNFSRGYPRREEYVFPKEWEWERKYIFIEKRYQQLTVKEINNLDVDAVIHFAAYNSVKESVDCLDEYFVNNDYGTLKFLEKLLHTKKKPFFLFPSTTEIYWSKLLKPVKELLKPCALNFFSATKMAGEAYCSAFFNWHNYPIVITRLSKIYGENHDVLGYSSVACNFISRALREEPLIIYGCGGQKRDFIYAGDVATAIVKILRNKENFYGSTLDIASGKLTSIEELAREIVSLAGTKSDIIKLPCQKGDYNGSEIDVSKTRALLDWKTNLSLREGIMKTLQWQRKINNIS